MITGKPSDLPHSSSLRSHRSYGRSGCWFVTKCVEPRLPVLVDAVARAISEAFRWYAGQSKLHVAAFIVMPDHWHLMFHTAENEDVGMFMGKVCHWISRKTGDAVRTGGTEWQDGFHETRVKSLRQFQFVRAYIEDNPVRKNWVAKASEWEWSSAHPKFREIVPEHWPFEFEEESPQGTALPLASKALATEASHIEEKSRRASHIEEEGEGKMT